MEELDTFREFLNAKVVTLDELNENMEQWTVGDVMELKKRVARTADYIQRAERAQSRCLALFEKNADKVGGGSLLASYKKKGAAEMVQSLDIMFPDGEEDATISDVGEVNEEQVELFDLPTNLTGEDAWSVALQVSGGSLSLEKGRMMVADVDQLDKDLRYIEDIVNQS